MKHSIRKPQMKITGKGIKVTRPTMRIGGKAGINISSHGASASLRTKKGSISTRRGCRINFLRFLGVLALALLAIRFL